MKVSMRMLALLGLVFTFFSQIERKLSRFLIFTFIFIGLISGISTLVSASSICGTAPASVSGLILGCYSSNVINTQTIPTNSGFQLNVTNLPFNAEAGNWIAYNALSATFYEAQATSANSAFINLGTDTIDASGSFNGILTFGIGAAGTNFNIPGNDVGVCASCSSTYDAYSNGAATFPIMYYAFPGTSPPSGITTSGAITFNDGAELSGTGAGYLYTSQTFGVNPNVIIVGHVKATGTSGGASNGELALTTSTLGCGSGPYVCYLYDGLVGSTWVNRANGVNGNIAGTFGDWHYISMEVGDSSATFWLDNSNSNTIAVSMGATTENLFFGVGGPVSTVAYLDELFALTAAPNNVQPEISFSSFQPYGGITLTISPNPAEYPEQITITANCGSSIPCAVDNPEGTHLATGTGTATLTYAIGDKAIGSYSGYVANAYTLGLVTAAQTLTINSGHLILTFTKQCSTSTPIYTSPYYCTTTAEIPSFDNLAIGHLYLNGNLVGSTTSSSNTVSFSIGTNALQTDDWTFSSSGTGNYASNSTSYSSYVEDPIYSENMLYGGSTVTSISLNSLNSPLTQNSYYPYGIFSNSPSPTLNYTVTVSNSVSTTTPVANTATLAYIPSPNQPAGAWAYNVIERQTGNPNTITLQLTTTANMIDMEGTFSDIGNCYPSIQKQPNCLLYPWGTAKFSVKPTTIEIKSDSPSNSRVNGTGGSFNVIPFSNNNKTFSLSGNITLTYPSPFGSFVLNLTNNPSMQTSITQDYGYTLFANSVSPPAPYTRKYFNITTYDQRTFTKLSSNVSVAVGGLINNYTIGNVTNFGYNSVGESSVYLWGPASNYQTPIASLTSITVSATATSHFLAINNYCPQNINGSTYITSHPYLVDLNGSLYTYNVYSGYGNGGIGYFMQVMSGVSPLSTQLVQQYKINGNPFAQPLENGGSYAFKFLDSNCKYVYASNYSVWGNPLTISITVNDTVPMLYLNNATATCSKVSIDANTMEINCTGTDPTSTVTAWDLTYYDVGLNGWEAVNSTTINSSSFSYSFNGLDNSTQSRVIVVAHSPTQVTPYIFDFNSSSFEGLGLAIRAFLTLMFLLVGLGIGAMGIGSGMISQQHIVSTTTLIELFMFILSWAMGVSTFIPFVVIAILWLFLLLLAVAAHRYEGGWA